MARRPRRRDHLDKLQQAQREQRLLQDLRRITPKTITINPILTAATIGNSLRNILLNERSLLPGYALQAAQLAADTIRPELELPGKKLLVTDPKTYTNTGRQLYNLETTTIQQITSSMINSENTKAITDILEATGYKTVNQLDAMEIQYYNQEATTAFIEAGEEWQWVAECDATTCPYCWAMHGTTHPATESMIAHNHCRCQARRVDARRQTADSRFDRLSQKQQNMVLGPTAGQAYREGKFSLSDTFEYVDHPQWGRVMRRKNLTELLGNQ